MYTQNIIFSYSHSFKQNLSATVLLVWLPAECAENDTQVTLPCDVKENSGAHRWCSMRPHLPYRSLITKTLHSVFFFSMVYANTDIVPNCWCNFELILQYCSIVHTTVHYFLNEVQFTVLYWNTVYETVTRYSAHWFSVPADTLLILSFLICFM